MGCEGSRLQRTWEGLGLKIALRGPKNWQGRPKREHSRPLEDLLTDMVRKFCPVLRTSPFWISALSSLYFNLRIIFAIYTYAVSFVTLAFYLTSVFLISVDRFFFER